MDEFAALLEENRGAVERYVRFRINSFADAEDILQETYTTAFTRFASRWPITVTSFFRESLAIMVRICMGL